MLNVNGVMEEYIYVSGQIFLKQFYIPRVLHFFFADDLSRNPGLEKKETLNIYSIKELIWDTKKEAIDFHRKFP